MHSFVAWMWVSVFFVNDDIRNAQISQRKKILLKIQNLKNSMTIFFSLSLISLFIPDCFFGVEKKNRQRRFICI